MRIIINSKLKKIVSILIFVSFYSIVSFGKSFNKKIDSLQNELSSNSYFGMDLVDLLNNLSYAYRRNDREKILQYAQSALHLADSINYRKGLGYAYKNIGLYSNKMDFSLDSAFSFIETAHAIAKEIKDYNLQIYCLSLKANKYSDEQLYGNSIKLNHEALALHEIHKPFNDYRLLLMGNMACSYFAIEDYITAIEKFDIMFKHAKKIAPQYISFYKSIYAVALHEIGKSEKAIQILYQEAPILEEIGDYEEVFYIFLYLTNILIDLKDYQKAQETIIKAQEIIIDYNLTDLGCVPLVYHSLILSNLGKHDEALLKGEKSYLCFANNNHSTSERLSMVENLIMLYITTNKPNKAVSLFEEYSKLLKEKYDLDQRKIMAKSELARSNRENELLKEIQVKDKATIANQKYIFYSLFTIAFLLIGIMALLYNAYQRKKRLSAVLLSKVEQRTQELKVINNELLQSNKELEKFAYIASHDLKEPLRSIISFTGLLKREIKNHLSFRANDYMDYITKGGAQMQNIIDSVLEFATLNEKPKNPIKIDTNNTVSEVTDMLSDFIKKNNGLVKIENNLPKLFYFENRILMLFKNIIENGLKYNNADIPTVLVSYKTEDNKGVFTFKDNGIGIDEKYHDLIFKMFKRLASYNTYEGTGIGLAYCKKIVNDMGGEISLNSKLGEGSEFYLALPLSMIIENSNLHKKEKFNFA